jgi:hydrogenase small subunit
VVEQMVEALSGEKLTNTERKPDSSRRAFLQFCGGMAATLGLSTGAEAAIARSIVAKHRPPVIWLHFSECTGCTESMLVSEHPAIDKLILDLVSLDYHETLFAGAGHQAEAARKASMAANKGKYLLVVEGAIPAKDGGIYCKIGGRTAIEILSECAQDAAAVIALGSCASWGGMPSAQPNPTGCVGVSEVWKGPVVNIPGCPPNPYNFLSTVVYYITYGRFPDLDSEGRPKFAYSRLIHENCERRPHFDAGHFVEQFGDAGHRSGWCLYKMGCKGPETYANCPAVLFGDAGGGSWPVGTGHPCIGCTEKSIAFRVPTFQVVEIHTRVNPPATYPQINAPQGRVSPLATGLAGLAAGAALGAGYVISRRFSGAAKSKNAPAVLGQDEPDVPEQDEPEAAEPNESSSTIGSSPDTEKSK